MYIFNSLMQGDDSNPPYTEYMQELRLFKALREIESVRYIFVIVNVTEDSTRQS